MTGTAAQPELQVLPARNTLLANGLAAAGDVITYPFKYNSKFDAELMQSVASSHRITM